MASTGMIGEPFPFQVLFVNGANTPIVVSTPTIEVYYFTETGAKVELVAAGTPMLPVAGDVGRYQYLYDILDTFTAGQVLYGLMRGVDTSTADVLLFEETVNLVIEGYGSQSGMRAHFISYSE